MEYYIPLAKLAKEKNSALKDLSESNLKLLAKNARSWAGMVRTSGYSSNTVVKYLKLYDLMHLVNYTKEKGKSIPLFTKEEVLHAIEKSPNKTTVTYFLKTGWNTLQKYIKMYGLENEYKNIDGKGGRHIPKFGQRTTTLMNILAGKHPHYPLVKLKNRLIHNGLKDERCEGCDLETKRIVDGKVPLILLLIDDTLPDNKRFQLDNLMFKCYNCCFYTEGLRVWNNSFSKKLFGLQSKFKVEDLNKEEIGDIK